MVATIFSLQVPEWKTGGGASEERLRLAPGMAIIGDFMSAVLITRYSAQQNWASGWHDADGERV